MSTWKVSIAQKFNFIILTKINFYKFPQNKDLTLKDEIEYILHQITVSK